MGRRSRATVRGGDNGGGQPVADAAIGVVRERAGLTVTCWLIGMCRPLMGVLMMAEVGSLTLLFMRADARRRGPGPLERQQEHQHDVEDAAHEGRESSKAADSAGREGLWSASIDVGRIRCRFSTYPEFFQLGLNWRPRGRAMASGGER